MKVCFKRSPDIKTSATENAKNDTVGFVINDVIPSMALKTGCIAFQCRL